MRFRNPICLLLALLTSSTGCGILGNREDLQNLVEYNSDYLGCMNDLGGQILAFADGGISKEKWGWTWDCAAESLRLFRAFVRPSDNLGYTQRDIQLFVSNFLITDFRISDELVEQIFALKATFLGGTRDHLSSVEIDRAIEMMRVFRDESLRLIDPLANRIHSPTPLNMVNLAHEFSTSGEGIASNLKTAGNPSFTRKDLTTLLTEIDGLFDMGIPEGIADLLMVVKVMAVGGSDQEVEAEMIPKLHEVGVSFFGAYLALVFAEKENLRGPNEYGEFLVDILDGVRTVLFKAIASHSGAMNLDLIDELVDSLPAEWISTDREAIKATARPLINRLLLPDPGGYLTSEAIQRGFTIFETWNRQKTHLHSIFQQYDLNALGVEKSEFKKAANAYKKTLTSETDRGDIEHLKRFVTTYKPIFLGDENRASFLPWNLHSLHNLNHLVWLYQLSKAIVEGYASNGESLSLENLEKLHSHATPLAYEMLILDPTSQDWYANRFIEADLFTFNADGDGFLSIDEITMYVQYMMSISELTDQIRADIEPVCTCSTGDPDQPLMPSCQGYGIEGPLDAVEWQWMDISCFREEFFSKIPKYWDHFPFGVEFYETLSPDDQFALGYALETSAREFGYSPRPTASYDITRFAGTTHFVESIVARADQNLDQVLDKDEAFAAFPVYKKVIADIAEMDVSEHDKLEAIYSYLISKGKPPDTGFWGTVEFVYWMLIKPFWKINADRLDIYKVTSFFSQ